jgi:hypothetical protein
VTSVAVVSATSPTHEERIELQETPVPGSTGSA